MNRKVGFSLFVVLFGLIAFGAVMFTSGLKSAGQRAMLQSARDAYVDKDFDAALRYLASAEELDSTAAEIYMIRGQILVLQLDYDGALVQAEKAIAADPRGSVGYLVKGQALLGKIDGVGAEAALLKAGDLGQSGPDFHFLLGSARLLLGRIDDGMVELRKAVAERESLRPAAVNILATFGLTL